MVTLYEKVLTENLTLNRILKGLLPKYDVCQTTIVFKLHNLFQCNSIDKVKVDMNFVL